MSIHLQRKINLDKTENFTIYLAGLTLHAIIVERSDGGVGVVFEDDPVGVGGDPLLGARVEVVGARVVFVGGPEGDGVLLEAAQDWRERQASQGDNTWDVVRCV